MKTLISQFALFCVLFFGQTAYAQEMANRHTYQSFDGQPLSFMSTGEGPTLLLLHGFMSSAEQNFFGPGIARKLAASGYRVIAPDFRGHGNSQVSLTVEDWPKDAAAQDQIALLSHLETEPYAIIGYSYGAITALRLHLLSRQGGVLVLGGVGDAVADENNMNRNNSFRTAIQMTRKGIENDVTRRIQAQINATGGTLNGYEGALTSRIYTPADLLATFEVPVLVMTGDQDNDNGSGEKLAEIIPNARHQSLKGNHITAVGDPLFADHILRFLEMHKTK